MAPEVLQQLLSDYVSGSLDAEGHKLLAHALNDPALLEQADVLLRRDWDEGLYDIEDAPEVYTRLQAFINAHAHPPVSVKPTFRAERKQRWYWAAAAIIILLGGAVYLWIGKLSTDQIAGKDQHQHDEKVTPGKDGAVLTLADGTELVLDSTGNGVIATEAGTKVVLKDGQVQYDPGNGVNGSSALNTMRTPKGRQFRLTLPDGTRVWLNAASSLTYPVAFTEKERRVAITGEAYFEIADDMRKPFLLSVAGRAAVEVLGTKFCVNAYDNEETLKTTLLEGRVRVNSQPDNPRNALKKENPYADKDYSLVLLPGQQAQIANTLLVQAPGTQKGKIRLVRNVDIEQVIAWKNGLFNFEGASLKQVMQQLERWYDIEVVYESGIPDISFTGELRRNISLEGLIKTLQDSEVHFRIDGRRLVVLP